MPPRSAPSGSLGSRDLETGRPARLLILGGTGEAAELAERLSAEPRLSIVTSLAGRTRAPRPLPGEVRRGGFGGAAALADYLRREAVSLVVDATHPYAARISQNAAEACARAAVPRLVLARPPWRRAPGDDWREVPSAEAAAEWLDGRAGRVFLTIGRQELAAFAGLAETWFLVRLVEAAPLPLERAELVLGRGPFGADEEAALLRRHAIEAVVSKNSGGAGTYGKIAAARALGLPVVMIARPPPPPGETAASVAAAADWVARQLD